MALTNLQMSVLVFLVLIVSYNHGIRAQQMVDYEPLRYTSPADIGNWWLGCGAHVTADGTVQFVPNPLIRHDLVGTMTSKVALSPSGLNFGFEVRIKKKMFLGADGFAIYITPNSSVDWYECGAAPEPRYLCNTSHYGVLWRPGLTLGIRAFYDYFTANMFPSDAKIEYPTIFLTPTGFAWPFVAVPYLPNTFGNCPSALITSNNFVDLTTKVRYQDSKITVNVTSAINDTYSETWTCADDVPLPGLTDLIKRGDAVLVISGGAGESPHWDDPVVQSVRFFYPDTPITTTTPYTPTRLRETETPNFITTEDVSTTEEPTTGAPSTEPGTQKTSTTLFFTGTPEIVEGPWNVTLHDLGTCGYMEVTGNVTLSDGTVLSGKVWNGDLDTSNTKTFKLAVDAFSPILWDLYKRIGSSPMENVVDITINGFRQGSIISDYIVTLRTLTDLSEAEIQAKVDQVLASIRKAAISYGSVSASQIAGVTVTSSVLKRIYIPKKTAVTASSLARTVKTNRGSSFLMDAQLHFPFVSTMLVLFLYLKGFAISG